MTTFQGRAGKREILGRHDFFRALPPELLDGVAARSREIEVPPGRIVFAKGDEGDSLMAVMSGLVKISAASEHGHEVVLNLIGPDQVFGEIALLDGRPRTADATAVTTSRLLVLGRTDFVSLLLAEPRLGVALLKVVGGRLRRTSEQLETLSFRSPTARLAATLLRLADLQMTPGSTRIPLTQREIGHAACLTRESTNKKLRAWAARGIVELTKAACVIRDVPGLARIAGGDAGTPRLAHRDRPA